MLPSTLCLFPSAAWFYAHRVKTPESLLAAGGVKKNLPYTKNSLSDVGRKQRQFRHSPKEIFATERRDE